jgi:hypothetical protein
MEECSLSAEGSPMTICKDHGKPKIHGYERIMPNGAVFDVAGCEDCKAEAEAVGDAKKPAPPKKEPVRLREI